MSDYDFFIAYASPDRRQARQLCWYLQDESCAVFLDEEGLTAGASWPPALRKAMEASRAIVMLVSAHTDHAFYEQEEIVRALQLARDKPGAHTVIPVLLEKLPQGAVSMPYGTSSLQAQDATRPGGLKRVAAELATWLDDHQRDTAPGVPLSAVNYQAFGAALRLDRYPHWSGILEAIGRSKHWLFLLHGSHQQNVGLFVERIQRYLSSETSHPHLVCRVRFNWDGVTARCGADWVRHVRLALRTHDNPDGNLTYAARHQALFLILGLRPLDRLDDGQQSGLQEFIEVSLPVLLREVQLQHEVRVLLPLEYEETASAAGLPPLVQRVDAWGRKAQATGELRYLGLPQVTLPTWQDVEHYLATVDPPPPPETVEALRQEYLRLTSGRPTSYQELAESIDRYLQDA